MIIIEKQGGVVMGYNPDHAAISPLKPAKRGEITEFSRKARRRMMIELNRLDYTGRVVFLTLTFHGDPTVSQSNAAFKRFRSWLSYSYPNVAAIWRRETQPKRGAIHFHLLLFGLPFIDQRALQAIWTRCTREDRSIVHITLIKSRTHAMRYVSKYVAKMPEAVGITSLENGPYLQKKSLRKVGRAWGWINHDGLPFAPTTVLAVADSEMERYLWWFIRAETRGKCGNDQNVAMLFADGADEIIRFIRKHSVVSGELPPETAKICRAPWMQRRLLPIETVSHEVQL